MKKIAASIKAPKNLSTFAAIPKDPAKTQRMSFKRQLEPKDPHKLVQPKKLKGSV